MENKQEKTRQTLSNMWKKTADISKKAAEEIHKGAKNLSEQTKKSLHDQKVKKYNPLFKEDFESANFKIPNVIEIVDDAVRRDIDVCEGAIGWTDTVNDVEIFHLYDEWINESKIKFIPFAKCDAVYCIDNFERNKFINVESAFERTTNEKLAELEHIAYCLGAKCCSIEISESNEDVTLSRLSASITTSKGRVSSNTSNKSGHSDSQHGKNVSYFEGNTTIKEPTLKWFKHDDNINGLIKMRCSENGSITSKVLEIKCSSSTTMSQKTACAVDKILKSGASISMEKQALKEHASKLIFEVIF